jgi:Na+/H+-dicarboxylate symporter
MGHSQKAKRIFWITILGTLLMAAILIMIPVPLGRPLGLGLELVWYFVFPKIQDREFRQWEATHPDVVPSSGWKALGWGFAGLVTFFAIAIGMGILLDATGIAPQ